MIRQSSDCGWLFYYALHGLDLTSFQSGEYICLCISCLSFHSYVNSRLSDGRPINYNFRDIVPNVHISSFVLALV